MTFNRLWAVLIGATLMLPACSFTEEALWPSLSAEDPTGEEAPADAAAASQAQQQQAAAQQQAMMPANQPQLGTTNFVPPGVTPGAATGTRVGKKVAQLREELQRMQASIGQHNQQLQQVRGETIQDSQRYHGTVAAINARLQVGTTPGNPILVQQFNSALADLDRLNEDINQMNQLTQGVGEDSATSAYMSESVRAAFQLSGAVDEDHRQLSILEDEVNRTVVLIERLLKEVTEDVRRQTGYIRAERANLNTLSASIKSGEMFGSSLVQRAATNGGLPLGAQPMSTAGRKPLVVIRFDRTQVPYEKSLYSVINRVLQSQPAATFDLVAVAPTAGGSAKAALNASKSRRNAEGVLRSLVEMGLPADRVVMSAQTSGEVNTNEVHLFMR